ncbi:MAG: glycosyltransferase [Planctomycetes bacterium]|nr:glycosyltransferase [Planctomycetota bacterium]
MLYTSRMTDPIRVLLAIGSMNGGGAERQMLRVLDHLDRASFTPLLYLVNAQGELLAEIPNDISVVSFSEQYRPSRLYFPGRIHRQQVKHFEQTLRQFQIDVVYDRTFFMTLISAPGCRRSRVPRVSVIDCDPRRDFEATAGRFVGVKRRLLSDAYRTAVRTVAVSEGVRRDAIDYFQLAPENVTTMYNFIDLRRIDRLAAEEIPDWPVDRFHIVACGRLHAQKGYDLLLNAVADAVHRRSHSSVLLHILGSGPLQQDLETRIDALRLRGNVELHGFVTNPFRYFRKSQLFCLSSRYEGFGLVVAEAMACRVPVLATDCPSGPAEILEGGRYGRLVPPGDAMALADAIDDAIVHDCHWQEFVEPARQHVERQFSPSARVRELEKLLSSAGRSHQNGRAAQ